MKEWKDIAFWLYQNAVYFHYMTNTQHTQICTITIATQNQHFFEEVQENMQYILHDLLGAYITAPMLTYAGMRDQYPHFSFGFWNDELLENARRILPLPEYLLSGPIVYMYPDTYSPQEEKKYNKRVADLPRME